MALSEQQSRRLQEWLSLRAAGSGEVQYLRYLQGPTGAAELAELIDLLVVSKTELFRDERQLQALRAQVLAPLAAQVRRPLRVWSAGCATGEEVATLLVLLAEAGAHPASTVLGTDISEAAVAQARALRFSEARMQRVPAPVRERYFLLEQGLYTPVPLLRERAQFKCHNLMDEPYPTVEGEGFDVIACRNVLIYFPTQVASRVVERLAERLVVGGILMVSSTEPLLEVPAFLRTVRFEESFFYVRVPLRQSEPLRIPDFTRPAVPREPLQPYEPAERPPLTGATGEGSSPQGEADALFAQVLEWAASGEITAQAQEALVRCLVLDPDLAPARYLQGMLLEQRGSQAEAAEAYRRALRSLEQGRARPIPFFLNPARLQVACVRALERLGRAPPPAR